MMKSIYRSMSRPIMSYASISWIGGLNKKYLVKKTHKGKRLACLMISSAFFSTPTGPLGILLNLTPIEKFLLVQAVRGSNRITVRGLWRANSVDSFGKTKSHVDVCSKATKFLPLVQMPANQIRIT